MYGISLDPDNAVDDSVAAELVLTEEDTIGRSAIPAAVKTAIIADKAQGVPTKELAIRYDCSEDTIRSVWREFVQSAAKIRSVANETRAETFDRLKGKAVVAIEAGLECDRDPYRRGALGVQVMKGIGEFKEDVSGARVAVLINNLPPGWKDRYITAGPGDPGDEK